MEKLYTQREAANMFCIANKTMGDWLRAGRVRGIKIGRHWLVMSEEIQRVVAEARESMGGGDI